MESLKQLEHSGHFFTLLHFYILLYQATECHTKFVIHAEGKSLDAEILVNLQRAEVRAQRSVFPAGQGDVAAAEHARVAPRPPRDSPPKQGEMERVSLVLVQTTPGPS